jgi:hypothetical protein
MHEELSGPQKDELLRGLLPLLANRGIARTWAALQEPVSSLMLECRTVATDGASREEFRSYLQANPIIQQTVETLLSHLAMTANVRWQDIQGVVQPLARRGWHIARWLPTFLLIDGPLARFLKNDPESPLNSLLKRHYTKYPVLAQARDAFNHDLFREIRNGVGHWSFQWEETGDGPRLVMMKPETGRPTVTITLLEAEAIHLLSFSVIEALDRELFSRVNPRKDAP